MRNTLFFAVAVLMLFMIIVMRVATVMSGLSRMIVAMVIFGGIRLLGGAFVVPVVMRLEGAAFAEGQLG